MAWIYVVLLMVSILGSRLLVSLKHPELLAERAQFTTAEGAKSWDQKLSPLVAILGPLLISVVAGLDRRFNWPPVVPTVWQWIATLAVVAGFGLATWAIIANRFFSAVVRIQKERGHTVITDGPYRIVRHPSYAGAVLAYLAIPVMLDALWALAPAVLTIAAVVIRTALEDRTLCAELPGYAQYTQRTRYRLLPGVW
jgi:protein-S-isoprenylcysteine O-methyltransferase Ste14